MPFQYPYQHLNPEEYAEVFQDPLWYLRLHETLKEYFYSYNGEQSEKTEAWIRTRAEFVELVMELLSENRIALGTGGVDYDVHRKEVDTVMIHHSGSFPDGSLHRFEALGLIRVYAPVHANPEEQCHRKPIWSNHFFEERQTFLPYHYLVYSDGKVYQTLQDKHVGWHCGNWEYNCKSIGTCFVGNLMESSPTPEALESAREIIARYNPKEILGHREVKENRTCPGNLFLGENGWKKELLTA